MSREAEKEASEVLHSLLSIERIQDKSKNGKEMTGELIIIKNEQLEEPELDVEERQNETIDIETIEEHPQKEVKGRYKKSNLSTVSDNCDSSEDEDDTPESVEARLKQGCECQGFCFKDLDAEQVYRHRLNIAELTKSEHDMYLMGVTMACVANIKKTYRQKDRQRQRASYVFQGKKVCLEAFLFLENVTQYHIKRIRSHVLKHGVTPRVHGNLGKKPHNTFSLDMYKNLENYIKKYLKTHVTDPHKNQIIYGVTRADIYNSYKDHGRKSDEKLMGYSTFRRFMKKQFPQIKFQKVDHSGKHGSSDTPKKKMRTVNKKDETIKRPARNLSIDVSGHSTEATFEEKQQNIEMCRFYSPVSINASLIDVESDANVFCN